MKERKQAIEQLPNHLKQSVKRQKIGGLMKQQQADYLKASKNQLKKVSSRYRQEIRRYKVV